MQDPRARPGVATARIATGPAAPRLTPAGAALLALGIALPAGLILWLGSLLL
ncbi:hypothetical protein [Pseudoroseicyclus sp. CXY001]|uniref:hypothetical protein n=1 Tax=Pseudoroseicyclus sp. CXY001 TaxID=3242492 RepID=UPI003570CE4E